MARGRAYRREQLRKRKVRAKQHWQFYMTDVAAEPTDKWVGHMAGTHCRPCSCYLCGSGGETKPSDRRAELSHREQLLDLD